MFAEFVFLTRKLEKKKSIFSLFNYCYAITVQKFQSLSVQRYNRGVPKGNT